MAHDDSDGVWRTIGGRRVFIRTGATLSQAMKESGKFKNLGKKIKNKRMDKKLDELREKEDEDLYDSYDRLYGISKYNEEETSRFLDDLKSMSRISDNDYERLKRYNEGTKERLANKIKNFDESKVSHNKWTAEEQMLARLKNSYDVVSLREGKEFADKLLDNVKVVEKSDDYILYTTKRPDSDSTNYRVAASYDKNDRGSIDIEIRDDWDTSEITGVEVNWSAIGSVGADEAKRFAERLMSASNFAQKAEKKIKGQKRWQ